VNAFLSLFVYIRTQNSKVITFTRHNILGFHVGESSNYGRLSCDIVYCCWLVTNSSCSSCHSHFDLQRLQSELRNSQCSVCTRTCNCTV